jgi:hypothetical protein
MFGLQETDVRLHINRFSCGTRDFIFYTIPESNVMEIIHPMELLGLKMAVTILKLHGKDDPDQALILSLARLLIPCLEYRGNRRHIVNEGWDDLDLRGETLYEDTRTVLARELAAEQAAEYQVVQSGEYPTENSLAQIFWEAHTELPDLPDVFVDPEMSRLTNMLYYSLVPKGEESAEIATSELIQRVMTHWNDCFRAFDLETPVRERRKLFKKVLAASIRFASQMNEDVAKALIFKRLGEQHRSRDRETFTPAEKSLLELRYGGSRDFRDINLGLLFGCGPLFEDLINDFVQAHLAEATQSELDERTDTLRQYIYLLVEFRERRKLARAHERREQRQSTRTSLPEGHRLDAENQADVRVEQPDSRSNNEEIMDMLNMAIDRLKPRDAERVRAYRKAKGDRSEAARILGIDREKFNRLWRQTTWPNVQKAICQVKQEME